MKDYKNKLKKSVEILKNLDIKKDPFIQFNLIPIDYYKNIENTYQYLKEKPLDNKYKTFFKDYAKEYLENIFSSYSEVNLKLEQEKEEEGKRIKFRTSSSKVEFSRNPLSYLFKMEENDLDKAMNLIEKASLLFQEGRYNECKDVLFAAYNYNSVNVNLLYNLFLINYIVGEFFLANDFLNQLVLLEDFPELEYFKL